MSKADQIENTSSVTTAMPSPPPVKVAKRAITIGKTTIHIKSVFTGQRQLDDALISIVDRRLAEHKGQD